MSMKAALEWFDGDHTSLNLAVRADGDLWRLRITAGEDTLWTSFRVTRQQAADLQGDAVNLLCNLPRLSEGTVIEFDIREGDKGQLVVPRSSFIPALGLGREVTRAVQAAVSISEDGWVSVGDSSVRVRGNTFRKTSPSV